MIDEEMIRHDYELLRPGLNERGSRISTKSLPLRLTMK